MAAFSDELLAVVDAFAANNTESIDTTAYQTTIQSNADELDSVEKADLATRETKAALVCKAASFVFGDSRVVTPQSSNYDTEKSGYWSQLCWLPAACFINLSNVLDVALALKIVTTLQIPFAVRSGGHMANPGFSGVDGRGVVLDMGGINGIQLSPDKKYVSLGTGGRWDPVYEYLEQHQLTTVGARAQSVGIGGLITGGGMSHFSNAWGMSCDNVRNYQVVLADSTVVNANAQQNADLFKALKGGMANLGIVTKIDIDTKPDYQLWYQTNMYNASDKDKVMKAAVEVEKAMEINTRLGFFLTVGPGFFAAGFVHRGWRNDMPPEFANAFAGITPMQVAQPATNGTVLSNLQSGLGGIAKREVGTATIRTNATTYSELADVLASLGILPFSLVFTFQPLSGPSVAVSNQRGGNILGVEPVKQSWIGLGSQWTDDSQNELAIAKCHELIEKLKAKAAERGNLLKFDFGNDASYIQSPLSGYGSANLALLKKASAKYDPKQVFQNLQNDGFLLSKL